MPRGSAVIPYHGKRGTVWRIKYADADGRQVMETLGREADGWTHRQAERALGAKLAEVERGMRKPRRRTFSDLADEFLEVALTAKPRKKSTVIDYKATIRNHLRPAFEHDDLTALSRSPEAFERYAAGKLEDGLSAKTVRNHLVLLGLMFKDREALALGEREPARPHRPAAAGGRGDGDAHGRERRRRPPGVPGARGT